MGDRIDMTLDSLDTTLLLPAFMRGDPTCLGLASAVDTIFAPLIARIPDLSTWNRVDVLPDHELDELAWELGIPWWTQDASADAKRQVLAMSPKLLLRLGTKWAVETVLSAYYHQCVVQEWWEYGAEPHHFRVVVQSYPDDDVEFYRILNLVKRASQVCDEITVMEQVPVGVNVGYAVGVFGVEQVIFE
ncbi:MAG: phage tail protein I [Micrococcales bacterium]|nr:phage tail protein I [Micrococcales bacterium]